MHINFSGSNELDGSDSEEGYINFCPLSPNKINEF